MTFRHKLLVLLAVTVSVSVAAIAWIVSDLAGRAFERTDEQRRAAIVAQFEREFQRRGKDVVHKVEAVAASESGNRLALAINRGPSDYGTYLQEAKILAEQQQLDFLEFTDGQGTIISSAQSPAKFGYKDELIAQRAQTLPQGAFLKREEISDAVVLGLFAASAITVAEKPLYVIGGRKLDKDFLTSIELPAGMRAILYQNLATEFGAQFLITGSAGVPQPEMLGNLVRRVQREGTAATEQVQWSRDPADGEAFAAIPLTGADGQLLGIFLVGSSRRDYVLLQQRIRSAALLVGAVGIFLSILLSAWGATHVVRPVEELATAAKEVGAGNWNAHVEVTSADEIGELAKVFNQMTRELLDQKERLVQTERVAAWRELARRLAHELRNPLFPLQLTVENLIRARRQTPEQFDEVLRESSSTLLAEIANLKEVISRFSEFSKMPQPQFQQLQLNDVVKGVIRLFDARFQLPQKGNIRCDLQLDSDLPTIAADPELLHRALSNLVLNAIDAMPEGGTLTIRTRQQNGRVCIEVSDTGIGLEREERERLFTPYYTSKQHGTGLGLAIVQSIVTDHGGRIEVKSEPGRGTTFQIELPSNLDKLQDFGQASHRKEHSVAAKSTSSDRG